MAFFSYVSYPNSVAFRPNETKEITISANIQPPQPIGSQSAYFKEIACSGGFSFSWTSPYGGEVGCDANGNAVNSIVVTAPASGSGHFSFRARIGEDTPAGYENCYMGFVVDPNLPV